MSHLANVAHQPLRRRVDRVEDHELCNSRTSCPSQICYVGFELTCVPAPSTLAVLDSLLYTLADELVPAAACAIFAAASEGDGVIIEDFNEGRNAQLTGVRGSNSAR
jgi:hypothetical protein